MIEEIKPEILTIFAILNQLCETNKIEPKIMAIAPQRLMIFKKDKIDLCSYFSANFCKFILVFSSIIFDDSA